MRLNLGALLTVAALLNGCGALNPPKEEEESDPEAEATQDTDGEGEDAPADDQPKAEDHSTPRQAIDAKKMVDRELAEIRRKLDEDALAVAKERTELDATKAELDSRLTTISALEKRLDEALGVGEIAKRRREERIGQLAKLLTTMPPKDAAMVIAGLPDPDAQALLLSVAQENTRKASKMLSSMPEDRASALGQFFIDYDPKNLTKAASMSPSAQPAGAATTAPATPPATP